MGAGSTIGKFMKHKAHNKVEGVVPLIVPSKFPSFTPHYRPNEQVAGEQQGGYKPGQKGRFSSQCAPELQKLPCDGEWNLDPLMEEGGLNWENLENKQKKKAQINSVNGKLTEKKLKSGGERVNLKAKVGVT